ncbi:MAG: hypothetical protein IPK68_20210 [Bdellovibrionales bacterium]|nr:hypothetical protein [Bdellovibrionales bacterium]
MLIGYGYLGNPYSPSIRISPFSIFDGITQLSLHYNVTHKILLGFEGSLLTSDATLKSRIMEKNLDSSIDSYDFSAQSYGVRADYALGGDWCMRETFYLSAGLSKVTARVKSRIDGAEATGNLIFGRAMIGVQRHFMRHQFVINIATGISTALSQEYKVKGSSRWASEDQVRDIGSPSALDFSLGYVF